MELLQQITTNVFYGGQWCSSISLCKNSCNKFGSTLMAREKIHFLINPQHFCQQKYFARARVTKAA
jgi:hypothetical protein